MKISKELHDSIKLMSEGNPEGFTQFYSETYPYVYKRARFLMKNDEDALDITQETFIQAYKGITSLQDIDKVYAWLSGITYNLSMKLFDNKKKQPTLLNEESEILLDNIESSDADTSPEEAAQSKALSEIVKDMIEELPDLQKAAILAFYYDNMKIDDIAVMFDCSANTIKSRLNYAKKALQEKVLAHEKANNYKLCSVSPVVIYMALEALFGTQKYSIPAATASTLCTAAQGSLFASGAGTTATTASAATGATVAAGATTASGATTAVGLSFAAKAAIAIAAVTTTAVVAVTAATGGFDFAGTNPVETETSADTNGSSEPDSSSETDTSSEPESPVTQPLASIYETQFTDYVESSHYMIMVTDGTISPDNAIVPSLTIDSDIYILGKDGTSYAFDNVDEKGRIKYVSVAPFTASDKALAIVQFKTNYINLLMPDGTLFDANTSFRTFRYFEDFIVALISTEAGPAYNIYDNNLNLLKEGITGFEAISSCYKYGDLTVLHGYIPNGDHLSAYTFIYDKNWNCIDTIAQPDSGLNVYTVLNGKYLWAGDSLRDENYNEVTLPIPDYLHPNGEDVTIRYIATISSGPKYCSVEVTITNASGESHDSYYVIDDEYNFYRTSVGLPDTLHVECHGINVMYSMEEGQRYVVWQDTGERIFSMLDWDSRVRELYGAASVYGISADVYSDGSVLAWVAATSAEGYHESTFLLRESDGYSVEKAINLGVVISYRNGLYYSYDTKQIYLNHQLIDCHNIIFTPDNTYYVLKNSDGTFTLYDSSHTACQTSADEITSSFGFGHFITQKNIDGTVYYQLIH